MITTSQESHTPCTLTPQPQAANTSQGFCAPLIPHSASWVGTQEGCMGIPTFGCNSSPPTISSSSGWSKAAPVELTALQPLKGSALLPPGKRENPHLGASHLADNPQKSDAWPSRHKNLLLALLSCQPHLWPPWKPQHRTAAAWSQGDAGTWTLSQVTHTVWEFGIGPRFVH